MWAKQFPGTRNRIAVRRWRADTSRGRGSGRGPRGCDAACASSEPLRVEPPAPQLDEARGGLGDGDRARVGRAARGRHHRHAAAHDEGRGAGLHAVLLLGVRHLGGTGIADDRRRDIAADLDNLTIADPQVNRTEKSDRDAGERTAAWHGAWFAERVIAVTLEYELSVDARERDALEALLAGGGAQLSCVDADTTSPTVAISTDAGARHRPLPSRSPSRSR